MPLKNLLNKTTAFIKHHSMVIISAALVMAAVGLGFMENRTINSAAYGIGSAGSVGSTPVSHHGTSDKDARPCIGVTPTTYDLTKILDEGTHSWNKEEEGDGPEAELDHLRDRRDKMKRLGKAYGKIEVNMDAIEGGIGNDSILNYIIMKYNRINRELKLLDNNSQISKKYIWGITNEMSDYSAILLVFTKKLDPELTLNTKYELVTHIAKANKKINDKNILEPFKNKTSRKENLQNAIKYGNNVHGRYGAIQLSAIGDLASGHTGDEPASEEDIKIVSAMYSDLISQLESIETTLDEEGPAVRRYFGLYNTKNKKTSLHLGGKALMEIDKAKTGYSIRVPGNKERYKLPGKDLYESTTAIIHTYNSVLKYIDRSYTGIQSDIKKLKKSINKNKSKARHALKGEMPTKDEVRSKSKKRDWKSQFDPQSNDKNKKLQYVWHQVTKTDGTNIYKTGNVYNWKLLANLNVYHPMPWTKGTLVYCPLSSVRGGRDYSHSVEAFYGSGGYDVRVETKDGEYREDTAHTMIVLDGLDKIRGTNTIIGDAIHRGDIGDEKSIFSPLINKEISNMKDEAKNEKNGWTETKVSQKFDGRDDNKHSLLNYEAFFQYLGSHDYKHLNELLKAAQGKRTKELESDDDKKKKDNDANLKRLQRAQKLFAEFTDVTESSGVKTSHVQLFNKYIAHTLYNNITNKDSRAYKELDRIKDYGQPNKNTISAQRGLDEIKPKSNDAEAKIQKNIRESLKGDGDDDNLIRNLGWIKDSHINSISDAEKKRIAALDNMISPKYMTNEYCLAYLDLLLCGYSAAAANVKYPSKANTTRAWKEAIQDYIDSMTGDNNKYVVVRVDYGSWASSGSKMYFSSISSILNKKYNISSVTNMTTDPDKNAAAYSKGFIGMQYNGMEDNLLEFGWNGQITSYHKARNLGSYYYRVGRAIVENDKAAAKYADNWYSYNGIINRSIDFAKIESVEGWEDKFTSVSPWKTHWMEIIKGGMAFRGKSSKTNIQPIDYYKVDKTNAIHTEKRYSKQSKVPKTWHAYANGHYQYGSYITEPYSIYSLADNDILPTKTKFELRVYSAAAHGDSLSEPKPTKGKNGKEIHNTGEYMKNAESISNDGSAGAYTVKETENGLKVKIDVPSDYKDDFNKILNNKKAYIRVQYYLDKEHGNDEAESLECTDKFQETARDKDAVYKTVPGANDDGLLKASEAWNSGDSGATKNKDGYYKVLDLKDKIEATSNYYNGTKNGWKKAKGYMNLVWNDSIKEMEKGFEIKLKPGEEKHYRICLRAKIKLVEIDSKGKITPLIKKDDIWNEHGETFTNPVYVTYKVKAGKVPPEVPYKFYANTGEADTKASADMAARAEFKEGSVYNETFEAMAGVPTTRTMYFATGGEEFIVNMQAVYDDYVATKNPDLKANGRGGDPDEYRAVRKYTVHFKGVDCEYKPGDTFKALSAGASSSEKFVSNKDDKKAEKQVTAEKNNAVNPTGASSYNTSTNSHGSDTTFRAQWTGAISNNTGYPTESPGSFNPGKPGSPDPGNGYDVGNGSQRMLVNAPTNWDTSGYNTALQNAINWAKQMETIGKQKDGTVFRIDDSDGIRRVYHIGDAEIKISLTGGGIGGIAVDGKSFNPGRVTGPTWTSGSASSAKIQSNDSATLGSGWYYNVGKDGVGSGYVAGCGHGCTKVWDTPPSKDSPGVPHTHTHQHGTFTPGVDMTHGKAATINYVINVTFKNGTITADQYDGDGANGQVDWSSTKSHLTSIPAHAMCGSCCEHVLPAVEDTWTQKLRYDTIRFTGLKVWKLDDGYATDMSEVKQKTEGDGSGVEKDPKTFADLSQAPGNGDESTRPITGNEADYVRSKVVRYDPNIFYNIAMDNTSKAGRLRYSLQTGQDDNVYYEEMGDKEGGAHGYTRTNFCDGQTGIGGTAPTPNLANTPVKVQGSGHKKPFCRGVLYSNSTYANDMNHHNNAKESKTKFAGWESLTSDAAIDKNKATVGPLAKTKTRYTSNTADAVDESTCEWKRFDLRRHQKNRVKVISDFLILQTSSGDQSIFYFEDQTASGQKYLEAEAQENFSDDFWYSKPTFFTGNGGDGKIHIEKGTGYVENLAKANEMWQGVMWKENPLRMKTEEDHFKSVNVGGYNGKYNEPKQKYNGTGHDEKVETAFDKDGDIFNGVSKDDGGKGAQVKNGEINQTTRIVETKAAQDANAQAMIEGDMTRNVCSPGSGNVFDGKSYDTDGAYNSSAPGNGSARMSRNTGSCYKAPTYESAWGNIGWKSRIPAPGVANFDNARLVLLQDGIALNPTLSNKEYFRDALQSWAFYKPIIQYHNITADNSCKYSNYKSGEDQEVPDNVDEDNSDKHAKVREYEFSIEDTTDEYLNEAGYTIQSIYRDGYYKYSMNDFIIHNPVSVQNAFVIGANSKYDQRIFGIADKQTAAEANEEHKADTDGCPGNAAECIYRVLNCRYGQTLRKAAFNIDDATHSLVDEEDPASGYTTNINSDVVNDGENKSSISIDESGFTAKRDDGVEPAFKNEAPEQDPDDMRPDAEEDDNETEDENSSAATPDQPGRHLEGSKGASLPFEWSQLGVSTEHQTDRYEVGGDFTFSNTGEEALFATEATTVKRRNDGKIEVTTANDGTYVSTETVGSGKHEILYRFAFDSVLFKDKKLNINGKDYTLDANTGVKVDGKDLTFRKVGGTADDLLGMKTMKDKYGTWARILYQDVSDGTNYFSSDRNEQGDSDKPGMFSKLKYLDNYKGSDGKYTFRLDYPDAAGDFKGMYNIWKQSSNPFTEQNTNSKSDKNNAEGFEGVYYQIPGYAGKGMEYNGSACILDGTVSHDNWWLAAGIIGNDKGYKAEGKQGGMPAWHDGTNSTNCAQVELWVLLPTSESGAGSFAINNMGTEFRIGNAAGGDLDASYKLDNIRVDRLPGATKHTASCFKGEESHAITRQNYYNGISSKSYKLEKNEDVNKSSSGAYQAEKDIGSFTSDVDDTTTINVHHSTGHWYDCYIYDSSNKEIAHNSNLHGKTDTQFTIHVKEGETYRVHIKECSVGDTNRSYSITGKGVSEGKKVPVIDWTGKHDDGSMTQSSENNAHTHTIGCLSSPTEGFKIAVREASNGDTTSLRRILGTKVWDKIKDRLGECYGSDGTTVNVGQTNTYNYKGSTEKVTLMPGKYEIEAYGAKGGNDSKAGGNGGYAKGTYKVDKATNIYIAAGGKGADSASGTGGGYNGGGNPGSSGSSGAGGGATSVSLANGTLRQVMANNADDVLLVAGGGGGGGNGLTANTTRHDSGYVTYGSERATNAIHSFTAQATGTVYFWSQDCNNDPWGSIFVNGQKVAENDDGGRGTDPDGRPFGTNDRGLYYNFNMSYNFKQGDRVELWVGSFSTGYSNNHCTWHYKYNGTRVVDGIGGVGGGASGGDAPGLDRNAYGGSISHPDFRGFGQNARSADGGGAGAGYYGGYGAENDTGAGGGSGYVSNKLTNGSQQSGVNSGNGYVKIKILELKTFSPTKVFNLVKSVIGNSVNDIPETITTSGHTIINPIWVCEGKYDHHICTSECKTNANGNATYTLNCSEPHHTGGHYEVGDELCYDACHDDAKHKEGANRSEAVNNAGKPVSAGSSFIRLDNYFQVYYPTTGDFFESNDLGIPDTRMAKGLGYVNNMDCLEWTREKWIKFPYSVLYRRQSTGVWEEHQADEWFEVDVGYYDSANKYHGYDTYDFYCQLRNDEVRNAKVEYMIEAINDNGPDASPYGYADPYGRNDKNQQDCPSDDGYETNRERHTDLTAYHSVYKYSQIDVVGRIGNLLFEDTTDWRFSNFFKQPKKDEWIVDKVAHKVNQSIQNMYYSWHLNSGDTSEDIRTMKVGPSIQWYNTYECEKWTDIGNQFYRSAPTPLEAYENYNHLVIDYRNRYGDKEKVAENLETEQMQLGYNLLWDIQTIGSYYGGKLQIEPKYYALDTETGETIPVDVYLNTEGQTSAVNYFGLMDEYGSDRYNELYHKINPDYAMYLDWDKEAIDPNRRNVTDEEKRRTQIVSGVMGYQVMNGDGEAMTKEDGSGLDDIVKTPMETPHGRHKIGNIQFQYLDDHAKTFIGGYTLPAFKSDQADGDTGILNSSTGYTDSMGNRQQAGINGDISEELWHYYSVMGEQQESNEGEAVFKDDYYSNGQRWHSTLGLPKSARFTDARDHDGDGLPDHVNPDKATVDKNGETHYEWEKISSRTKLADGKTNRYVILMTADITAIGKVWNLHYSHGANNGVITVNGKNFSFEQNDSFPTLLAVYGLSDPKDFDILQTH